MFYDVEKRILSYQWGAIPAGVIQGRASTVYYRGLLLQDTTEQIFTQCSMVSPAVNLILFVAFQGPPFLIYRGIMAIYIRTVFLEGRNLCGLLAAPFL